MMNIEINSPDEFGELLQLFEREALKVPSRGYEMMCGHPLPDNSPYLTNDSPTDVWVVAAANEPFMAKAAVGLLTPKTWHLAWRLMPNVKRANARLREAHPVLQKYVKDNILKLRASKL